MSVIRRNNCVRATLGTCYSVCNETQSMPPCIPGSHPNRITSTKCRINTVVSPDDGQIVAQNMYRLTNILRINMLRIYCAPSWLYLQDYTGMHGQQNIKLRRVVSHIIRLVQLLPYKTINSAKYFLLFWNMFLQIPFTDTILSQLNLIDSKPNYFKKIACS